MEATQSAFSLNGKVHEDVNPAADDRAGEKPAGESPQKPALSMTAMRVIGLVVGLIVWALLCVLMIGIASSPPEGRGERAEDRYTQDAQECSRRYQELSVYRLRHCTY